MTVAFSLDSKFVASGGEDMIIFIYDISKKQIIAELSAHTKTI
jgi:WD40 repeat protein